MQSTALAPRLRRDSSRVIAHPTGARLYHGPPRVQARFQSEAAPWQSLMRYIKGWAQADPAMIARAAADGYRFHDPLVGMFSVQRLSQYFKFLHAQFDCAGVRAQPAFYLHGPMDGSAHGEFTFFREAPQLGLTGIARILVGTGGVVAETVSYDLNMATEMLRRARS